MAYERQHYTNGDVLNAEQLNHMEAGIKENSDNIDKLSEDIADLKEKKIDKTTEEETLKLVTEMGLVEPVLSEDGLLYTDKDGRLFSL